MSSSSCAHEHRFQSRLHLLLGLVIPILTLAASGVSCVASTISVSPATMSLALGRTFPFTAKVDGVASTDVTWKILPAGAVTTGIGDLSTTGVYTAPLQYPPVSQVQIQATSKAKTTLKATATITLINGVPTIGFSNPPVLPIGISLVELTGTNFLPGDTVTFNGTAIPAGWLSSQQIETVINVPATGTYTIKVTNPGKGGQTSLPFSVKTLPATSPSYTAAVRFLEQSTFGPTPSLIAHVQAVGFQAFLKEQFALSSTVWNRYPDGNVNANVPPQFYSFAIQGTDQLRQRVALALSEIFVTSGVKINSSLGIVSWQNMLLDDAFKTYPELLKDVTLSPTMGDYLDMANNAKADPVAGTSPDENYAREVLQLFSIGVDKLNPDGTLALDANGNPIPNYSQAVIEGFSSAFTGWTDAPYPGQTAHFWDSSRYGIPMVPIQDYHDTNPKTLLNGKIIPGNQFAETDLEAALADISNHPNVGPFICKQLIQHLVTSNPSPAYVKRVAAIFDNDGGNIRGNFKAVVQAILLDPEARAGDNAPAVAGFGHLREPAIYIPATMRAFSGFANQLDTNLWYEGASMGQDITNSPDVFDYFPIGYQIPATGQLAPEMGIYSSTTAIQRVNWISYLVFGGGKIGANTYSISAWTGITDETILLDKLNLFFLHGQMSPGLQAAIRTALKAYPVTQPYQRAQQALYLVLTSPEYQVEQ